MKGQTVEYTQIRLNSEKIVPLIIRLLRCHNYSKDSTAASCLPVTASDWSVERKTVFEFFIFLIMVHCTQLKRQSEGLAEILKSRIEERSYSLT